MTLDEAITVSATYRKDHHSFSTDIVGQAMSIGEEAMKRLKDSRVQRLADFIEPLPGETQE